MNSDKPEATIKSFNWMKFIIATICVGVLLIPSFFAAFAEDEGTIGASIFWHTFAKLFYILRFPTHTLFWTIFSTNGSEIFWLGLFINCMFYGLMIERLSSLFKKRQIKI